MQRVAGLEREFSGNLHDCDAAVDGVDVHDADCAGDGCDFLDQIFIGIDDHDGGMTGAPVIGGSDEIFHWSFGELKYFFQKYFHFRRRRIAHDKGDGLAVRPAAGLSFADLHKIGQSDGGYGVDFVGDNREIARRRACDSGDEK